MRERPRLFETYPVLKEKVAFSPLGNFPSPVEHLKKLSNVTGADVWIKRDDCASNIYGGNKCRMMEWIIADAVKKGRKSLITWGAVGSNQILSSVIYGHLAGFKDITALYNDQPFQPYVTKNFLISTSLGVKQVIGKNIPVYGIKLISTYMSKLLRGKRPYLIPLVGSSPVSVLSYLDAALEIKEQIQEGYCPKPDYIFITVGTGGTAAGLMLGAMAFGGTGKVMGVRVLEKVFVNERIIAWEMNRAIRFLEKMGADLSIHKAKAADIGLIHDFIGDGYAESTKEGQAAIDLVRDTEGLDLDVTYTGKTMAAMLDFIKRKKGSTFLFWHTLNTVDLSPYIDKLPDLSKVSKDFIPFITSTDS